MKAEFGEARRQADRKFEDTLIEMLEITTPSGLRILACVRDLMTEYSAVMDNIERSYMSDKVVMIPNPGARNNED